MRGIDGGDFFSQRLILRVEVFGVEIGGGVHHFVRHHAVERNIRHALVRVTEKLVELRFRVAPVTLKFHLDSFQHLYFFTKIVDFFVMPKFFSQPRNFQLLVSNFRFVFVFRHRISSNFV